MKKMFFAALLAVGTLVTFFACNSKKEAAKMIDVVDGITPVQTSDWQHAIRDSLRNATPAERKRIMEEYGPRITPKIIQFLRGRGYACNIDTIMYRYGSGNATSEDNTGKRFAGTYTDQPYAIVQGGKCLGDGNSLAVFINCFNGIFALDPTKDEDLGGTATIFVIRHGQGINHHVDYEQSIWLARYFNLALFKGKGWKPQNQITPEEALAYKNDLDRTQVTVAVNPGDVFNLGNMTLNGRPGEQ